ncbi:hypothetical protein THIOM_002597 [Candidatus Thiomargarita nelsonii]|uniref:Uncharacterized protein n=1 Tax=Candidatus Thiomargarita nelsonii TaxID=1003181 RepID=A0A176S0P2_9GAMM|nr:hypothetical protein THIOM_002597 [Candidatus Thiomargarita nelsonii]
MLISLTHSRQCRRLKLRNLYRHLLYVSLTGSRRGRRLKRNRCPRRLCPTKSHRLTSRQAIKT